MTKFYTLLLLITAILASISNVSSQTNIAGGNVSGTWTLAGSPYLINGSIQIPNGQTLTIEPGVTVNFQGHYKIYVQGQILAIGTETDSITFTAVDTTVGWKGIRFDNTPTTNDSSKFGYCKIQYGKATGTGEDAKGGAFYINNFSKIIINHCFINRNSASSDGGGIYCYSSNPIINNNIMTFCSATDGYGGGILCYSSSPIISNNLICFNNAFPYSGGGISCEGGYPYIYKNIIKNNSSPNTSGGGIYCNSSNPRIVENIISFNTATSGAGISCTYSSTAKIIKNLISNNSAFYIGGGILCNSSSPLILNNSIVNNSITNFGGAIYCDNSNSKIINNTLVFNNASKGGAIYCKNNSDIIIKNSIMWGNTANSSGSQIYLFTEDSDPNIYYSNIQGGDAAFGTNDVFYTGTYQNNLDSNPLFVAPTAGSGTSYDGTTADWSLQAGSPCINAGTTDTTGLNLPSTDIAGNPRVSNGRIDIGAYEHLGTAINNPITNNSINIYPNPNNGKFLLYLENYESKNYALEIYDITGQIVYSKNYENAVVLDENIVLSEFESGVYLVKVTDGNNVYRRNIVVFK